MSVLAALLGMSPDLLKGITALLSLIAAAATATSAVHGFLNRRLRKSAQADAAATLELLAQLAKAFGVAKPEEIARIAKEAAREELAPVHRFFRAVEIAEKHRQHRPETDIIRIMESRAA